MFIWLKRIFFFTLVNILVMFTITLLMNMLGVQPYLDARGINIQALAVFCLIWGFGGAFISLLISRLMAKMMMGVRVIDPYTSNSEEKKLLQTVHELARAARISVMPEVGIYESPDLNAFATGPSKNRALVAVSSGLLQKMDSGSVRGVLGHEIAHVANGDMVTMTLIQGVVNAFVMFLARLAAFALSQNNNEGKRGGDWKFYVLTQVFEIILSFLGFMVVAYFSRAREYRADSGGARYAGRENMINALMSLQKHYFPHAEEAPAIATLKISGQKRGGLMALMSTHPPLEERIAALQRGS